MAGLIEINQLSLEQAALAYVSMGWRVLPLLPRKKEPYGKLVPHGVKQATGDLGQVRTWWEMYAGANIGLATGHAFDVVDLDGPEALRSLRLVVSGYKHTGPVAGTGKGFHLLFAPTGARNAANKLPGIDFRGQGGYIVASPSVHPNGHKYQWLRDGEIPPATDWLHLITTPKRVIPAQRDFQVDDIVRVFHTLFSLIRTLENVGDLYKTNCLWHEDDTPSLYLYPDTNSFFCFGCDQWGDTLDLTESASAGGMSPSDMREAKRKA